MRSDKEMEWKTLETKYLFKRNWLTAKVEKVELPDGRIYDEYYTLEYPTWINVIAITKDGKMILERQWRHGLKIVSTEIPAGVVEKGENPMDAAKFLVTAPNPSVMNNLCYTYLAEGVELVSDTHLDATEDLEVFFRDKDEVYEMLRSGQFCQALMLAPLWKFFATRT